MRAVDPETAAIPPPVEKTIAVLPFKSLGGDGSDELAEGLAEEITSELTDLEDLLVVSSATAARHARAETGTQQIGKRLGATHVVLGTVQWDDSDSRNPRFRVTPQLVRVEDDIQIWSESFDRSASDPLEVQSEIARAVVRQVGMSVLGWEGEEVLQALLDDQSVVLPVPSRDPTPSTVTDSTGGTSARRPSSQTEAVGASSQPEDRITEAGSPEDTSGLKPEAGPVVLEIHVTSRIPTGVLTLYADDVQILKEQFRYEKKSRLLRPKRALGGFNASREISSSTRTLRIYLLVDGESKLTTVSVEFLAGETRGLDIELLRKGNVEVHVE